MLRNLICRCDDENQADLLAALAERESQSGESRHLMWMNLLEELLGDETLHERLPGSLKDSLLRLLQASDQSLAPEEDRLSLPLTSDDA